MAKSPSNPSGLLDYTELADLLLGDGVDSFARQEIHVRERLYHLLKRDPLISRILFSDPIEDTFAVFDALIMSAGTWILLEAKERNARSTTYPTWLIERSKLHELAAFAKKKNIQAAWTSIFTKDDVAFVWPIEADHTDGSLKCNFKTLAPERGQKEKNMAYFSPSNAIVIR